MAKEEFTVSKVKMLGKTTITLDDGKKVETETPEILVIKKVEPKKDK